MGRIGLAFRAFFRILFDPQSERPARALLAGPIPVETAAQPVDPPAVAVPQQAKQPARSEAITLLAALQREARLVDFLQEPLDGYSDPQIGAAVREVHRQSAAVLQRIFDLRPLVEQDEGSDIDVPAEFDTERFRLTGNVAGQGAQRGRLAHPGWQATRCELPAWSGSDRGAHVVAPAEVDISG